MAPLSFGVLCTCLCAWGGAAIWWADPVRLGYHTFRANNTGDWWFVQRAERIVSTTLLWNWYGDQAAAEHVCQKYREMHQRHVLANATSNDQLGSGLPSWASPNKIAGIGPSVVAGALTPSDRTYAGLQLAQGWPFRCFLGVKATVATAAGDTVTGTRWLYEPGGFTFATRPMVFPFLANTVLFGALWIGARSLATSLIRQSRWRRSRCGACGYDINGLVSNLCPECGHRTSP